MQQFSSFIILTFIYSSTCFGRSPAHHQELNDCSSSLWFYLRIVVIAVLCSWSGRTDHEHDVFDEFHIVYSLYSNSLLQFEPILKLCAFDGFNYNCC